MLLGDILHAEGGRDVTQGGGWQGERPEILITAGITAPRASLSVQQCNHQPSTCNAHVAAASSREGRGSKGGGRGQGRGLSGCRTDG